MKATIIGSDLLQKEGSVKIIEINTNTCISNDGANLLDYTALFDLLTSNNITEFHYIWTESVAYLPLNQPYAFLNILKTKCLENNISFNEHIVPANSVTVPYIEDASHKFILRQAFDTTALVDDLYCADKFEFFNLMSGSTYIPKTYFTSEELNLNTLDEVDYTTTRPNLLIKSKQASYDVMTYPAIYNVTNSSQLSEVIGSVENGHLVQEFIFSEDNIVDGRYSTIRSIDIIYGPNLDIINMGGYTHSSRLPLTFSEDEFISDTRKLNQKTRHKYITKHISRRVDTSDYHTDDDSNILKYDGTLVDVDAIQLGDYIRSINFVDFNENEAAAFTSEISTYGWNGTLQQANDTLTQMQSELVGMISTSVEMVMIKVTLSDGRSWTESLGSTFFIEEKDSTDTRFEKINNCYIGDKIVVTDLNTNELTAVAISNLEMVYESKTIYTLDFAPSDLFLVDVGDSDFAVMHNGCWCSWSYCGNYCYQTYCPTCQGGYEVIK
jgi:hypothetical protein